MEAIVSFAQHRQDIILFHALKDVNAQDVFWIDVGANDPVLISVSLLFYMRGGHGINIEPQKELYQARYEKLRKKDVTLFVGIGEEKGEVTLHGSGDTATMTSDGGFSGKSYKVPVVTLDEIFAKYVNATQEVHFLKIDVEGFEVECIRGLDVNRYRPWIICVECIDGDNYEEYDAKIIGSGYTFVYYDGQNRYYVLNDKSDVIERFNEMDQLDELYEVISAEDATRYLSYEQSTSWKITAPLRKVVNLFNRLRRVCGGVILYNNLRIRHLEYYSHPKIFLKPA